MKYGYVRVSTRGQALDGNSIEAQEAALKNAGAEKIYKDTFTGSKTKRPEFDKLIKQLTEGDTLVVTKLDRFARTATQGFELIQNLLNDGVSVHVLNMGMIDNSPTGKLITHIMLSFAEFERDMIVERTQEGKAIAKMSEDFREGRPQKYTREQLEHAVKLTNDYPISQVVLMTGISKSTILRAKKKI